MLCDSLTPPVWRATPDPLGYRLGLLDVSIHAPRVEGDRNIWQGVDTDIPDVVLLLVINPEIAFKIRLKVTFSVVKVQKSARTSLAIHVHLGFAKAGSGH